MCSAVVCLKKYTFLVYFPFFCGIYPFRPLGHSRLRRLGKHSFFQ